MAEEKKESFQEWTQIEDMAKQAISTVADRRNRMENWNKNERTKLLKTKTECIEWLELQTSQLLTQQKEDEKVRRAIGHLSKMQQR